MNKKPSERITEIAKEIFEEHKKDCFQHGFEPCGISLSSCRVSAIIKYLDELAPQ